MKLPLIAAFALTVLRGSAGAQCDLGWFVIDGAAVLEGPATAESPIPPRHVVGSDSTHGRVVSLVGDTVSIEGVCPQTTARVTHKRKRTKVRASWDGCEGVAGSVKLRATIDAADCGNMRGAVQAKKGKPKRQRFTATRGLGNPEDCTEEDTFAVLQKRIFGPKGCRVASCHGEFEAGGLDLRSGAAHFSLVDQPATTPGAAGEMLVVPGNPAASFLWRKLAGNLEVDEGAPMPATGALPLDALELEFVRAWIAGGAPAIGRVANAPCLPHATFEPAVALDAPQGGHQIAFEGPILQPGEEVEGCMWIVAPNTEDFTVGKWEYSLNPGSHHFALWDHARGEPPVLNQFVAGDTACIAQGAPLDGRSISGAPEAPYFVDDFPAGTGDTIDANKILGINPHYFNEFDVPIQVKGWINLHPVEGAFQHEAETLFSSFALFEGKSAYSIFVEPFATGTLRLRMVNTLDRTMRIFHMSSHQHQRGTRFTAWNPAGEKIFENFDWAHPAILDFEDPYTLVPGDYIDFECEWDNGISREPRRCGDSALDTGCTPGDPVPVTFGVTAQDEMCFLVGFYHTD